MTDRNEKLKNLISGMLLSLSAAFVYYGVRRDEIMIVLRKAAMVCLECIGIG